MKIAGRKNDGAWYRANKLIEDLSAGEKTALRDQLADAVGVSEMAEAAQSFVLSAGITPGQDGTHADSGAWIDSLAEVGIPRQVWFGVLSYDKYERSGAPGSYVYTPLHREVWHAGAKSIRKVLKEFTFNRRQAKDLANKAIRADGNPGGIANAGPDGPEG